MSKAASSPTARLLQSSRLFSLPRPLPLQPELTSGLHRASETATTVHPTHQAITTPASSLSRGDWGLKRRIPRKKTASSTPAIRVRANDTYEHITDFTSAGDHVQTERKWAQMEVPLLHPSSAQKSKLSMAEGGPLSAFEHWVDNTDANATPQVSVSAGGRAQAYGEQKSMQRWKYDGPWIGGMQEGEFNTFLKTKVHHQGSRQSSWPRFLREKIVNDQVNEAQRKARDPSNRDAPSLEELEQIIAEIQKPLQRRVEEILARTEDEEDPISLEAAQALITEASRAAKEELRAYEKQLRDEHSSQGLSSDLTALICEYLDLPNVYTPQATAITSSRLTPGMALESIGDSSAKGPPTTHPSAGLGHLRTNAVMYNHPIHGPQKDKTPVESRVVRPRTRNGAVLEHVAKLGVGGVVADDALSATSSGSDRRNNRQGDMAHALEENRGGGNKIWVVPETAYIDHNSKIRMTVTRAEPEAVAVKSANEEEIEKIYQMKRNRSPAMARPSVTLPPTNASRRTALPPRRSTGVAGFDNELRGQR